MKASKLAFIVAAIAAGVYLYEVVNISSIEQRAEELQKQTDNHASWGSVLGYWAEECWYGFTWQIPAAIEKFQSEIATGSNLDFAWNNLGAEYADAISWRKNAMIAFAVALLLGLACRGQEQENAKVQAALKQV